MPFSQALAIGACVWRRHFSPTPALNTDLCLVNYRGPSCPGITDYRAPLTTKVSLISVGMPNNRQWQSLNGSLPC